jgi:quercetin dioxygenase-like cupin family protein
MMCRLLPLLACLLAALPVRAADAPTPAQTTPTGNVATEPATPTALAPAAEPVPEPEDDGPHPILAENVVWKARPGNPGQQIAWVLGGDKQPGPYILRVKLAQGARIPVHTHPDDRITTVMRGTVFVGFGSIFDETRVRAIPTGAVYLAPAEQSHYVWARDGEVEYQESGIGPTTTDFHHHE